MELPIIIAIPVVIIFTVCWIIAKIIREWWKMKHDQPRYVNEAERPALIKPKRRMYKGKGL